MNAIDLLKADHAKVQELFRQYDRAGGQPRQIAEQIFSELEIHAALEEELFYPALRGRLEPATTEEDAEDLEEDLVDEALDEHREVKTLIATLRALDPGDAQFKVKFAELRESVEEHVGMEEDELMPEAEAALGAELEQLGQQLEERKEQLMAGKP